MRGQNGFSERASIVYSAAIFCLIIFSGCATKEGVKSISDEEALRERIMAYWDYRIKKDFSMAYEYEYPLNRMSLTKYIERSSSPVVNQKSFELKSIKKRDGDAADVDLMVAYELKLPGVKAFEHAITITEQWVKVNDLWYHTDK